MALGSLTLAPQLHSLLTLFRSSVVKLVKNFRSHEAILSFPNEKFYRGDLQAFAPRRVIDSFINKAILPNPRFPILFHGIVGKDDRDASSPSFFNIDEVTEVKGYVMKLKEKYRISSSSGIFIQVRLLILYPSGPRNWYDRSHATLERTLIATRYHHSVSRASPETSHHPSGVCRRSQGWECRGIPGPGMLEIKPLPVATHKHFRRNARLS